MGDSSNDTEADSPHSAVEDESDMPHLPLKRVKFKGGKTPLHEAVLAADLPGLKKILSFPKLSWLNVKAKGGWTALHWATKCPSPEFIRLLLEKGADPTLLTREHNSVLHSAASRGTVEIVKMIVETRRLDINAQTLKGWTPIHCAVNSQKVDVLKFLIECKADIFVATEEGWLALHLACKVGSLRSCQALLEAADSERQKEMLLASTKNGWTPLFCAVNGMNGGHLDIVQWLVEKWKVPVDEPDCGENKYTPLHIASKLGFQRIAQYLIRQKANVDSVAKNGYRPLHWAALYNKEDVVDVLIANKATVNVQNSDKNTPLHLAKKKGHESVCEKICNSGADLSIRNASGFTAAEVMSEIPPEIRSRGKAAIRHFRAALRDGKTRPHRIKLMLLGDARVGKTSLFRYLTGQEFIDDLACTEGIDTRLISTPDVEPVSDTVWKVMDVPHSDFNDKIAQEIVKRVKQDEIASTKPRSRVPIEELRLQGDDQKSASRLEASQTVTRTETQAQGRPSTLADVKSVPRFAVPPAALIKGSAQESYVTQHRIAKDDRRYPSVERPQPYKGNRVRFSNEPQLHIYSRSYDDEVPVTKKRKIRRKRRSEPELLQHDFSELPMPKLKKHWQLSGSQDDETVKLSVWDFAGQPLYEPMHHIFLTRRAIYLIVLNLDKLTDKGITDADLQRIHMWVASVHAHTSLEPEPVRLFFVGTHKDSEKATEDRVKMAINQIDKCYQKSEEFACHIEYVPVDDDEDNDELLARVENSSPDFKDRNVCVLRNAILKAALARSYMKEDIPLSWLQFEEKILKFHQQSLFDKMEHSASEPRCLLPFDEMKEIAAQCNVDVHKGPFQTMTTFFHDVGLIVVPASMQGLDEEMKKSLEEFVIPNPQWLVDLMTLLVKLPNESKRDLSYRSDWLSLENKGILTLKLMRHIMHDLHKFSDSDVRILCLLFQALGFICKLLHRQISLSPDTKQLTEQMKQVTLETSRDESEQQQTDQHITDMHAEIYLVPCQLPEDHPDLEELLHNWEKKFYFDFADFLPPWLYLHLIVRLLTHMQQQTELQQSLKRGRLPILSKRACLMAQNLGIRFIIKPLANRIVVQHQLSDSNDEKKLILWLFGVVAEISKQKFKNLTFSCGHLCPHVTCLKKHIVNKVDDNDMRVFHYDEAINKLRRQGLAAAKCLYRFRLSASEQNKDNLMKSLITSINSVLSATQTEAHVEEMCNYTNGVCHYVDDVVLCDFADPGVIASQHLRQEPDSGSSKTILPQQALLLESLEEPVPVSKKHINLLAKQLAENPSLNLTFLAAALNVEVDETVKRLKSVREQCFQILTRWHAQAAAEDATIGYLGRAVEEAL